MALIDGCSYVRAPAGASVSSSYCWHHPVSRPFTRIWVCSTTCGPARPRGPRVPGATSSSPSNGARPVADVAEQRQDVDHRVVVERDVTRVILAQRKVLRPAAVRILGRAADSRCRPSRASRNRGSRVDPCTRARNRICVDGGVVVDRRVVQLPFGRRAARARRRVSGPRHVDVLRPAARCGADNEARSRPSARRPALPYHAAGCWRMRSHVTVAWSARPQSRTPDPAGGGSGAALASRDERIAVGIASGFHLSAPPSTVADSKPVRLARLERLAPRDTRARGSARPGRCCRTPRTARSARARARSQLCQPSRNDRRAHHRSQKRRLRKVAPRPAQVRLHFRLRR